jgi:transposase
MKIPLRKEREKKVVELRKGGKTIRKIAAELEISSRDVVRILRREEVVNSQNDFRSHRQGEQNLSHPSIYTEALKLFKKGMNPLDVTIELGADSEVTQKAYIDFLNLRTLSEVGVAYKAITDCLPFLFCLYRSMREKGLGLQDAIVALEYASDWKKAEAKLRATADAVIQLQSQKWTIEKMLSRP